MRCHSCILHITTKYEDRGNRVRLLKTRLKVQHVEARVARRDMEDVLLIDKFINMFTDKRNGEEELDPLSN